MGRGKRQASGRGKCAPVTDLRALLPKGPGWRIDWPQIEAALPLQALSECPQELVHHGEGDVLAHTKLVAEALTEDKGWRTLDENGRFEVFTAALLHDIAKTKVTRQDGGHWVAPGHSRKSAIDARKILWEAGVAAAERERICALVRNHMVPYFLIETAGKDPKIAEKRALSISIGAGCDRLALLSRADARGRIAVSGPEIELAVELFSDYCKELGCFDQPYPFASDHSRFLYFRLPDRDPAYTAYDDTRSHAVMMHGLPGAGKDHYIQTHLAELPVISLDDIRLELGIPAGKPQGKVIAVARERTRERLRAGEDFIWNATSISREMRASTLSLFADYNARIEIIDVEVDASRHEEQNKSREEAKIVPDAAINRMFERWETPDLTECHRLVMVEC